MYKENQIAAELKLRSSHHTYAADGAATLMQAAHNKEKYLLLESLTLATNSL